MDAKVNREDIFKSKTAGDSLQEIRDDNGVRVVNFTASKNMFVRNIIVTFIH
jgi:hypothetical protein